MERFFYDGAGNRTKHVLPEQYDEKTDNGEGRTYTYDEAGRLLTVTGPDGIVEETNVYDLWGNCVRRTDAEGYRSHYAYDLQGRLVRELVPVGSGAEDISYRMTEYAYDGITRPGSVTTRAFVLPRLATTPGNSLRAPGPK